MNPTTWVSIKWWWLYTVHGRSTQPRPVLSSSIIRQPHHLEMTQCCQLYCWVGPASPAAFEQKTGVPSHIRLTNVTPKFVTSHLPRWHAHFLRSTSHFCSSRGIPPSRDLRAPWTTLKTHYGLSWFFSASALCSWSHKNTSRNSQSSLTIDVWRQACCHLVEKRFPISTLLREEKVITISSISITSRASESS